MSLSFWQVHPGPASSPVCLERMLLASRLHAADAWGRQGSLEPHVPGPAPCHLAPGLPQETLPWQMGNRPPSIGLAGHMESGPSGEETPKKPKGLQVRVLQPPKDARGPPATCRVQSWFPSVMGWAGRAPYRAGARGLGGISTAQKGMVLSCGKVISDQLTDL